MLNTGRSFVILVNCYSVECDLLFRFLAVTASFSQLTVTQCNTHFLIDCWTVFI